MKTWFPVIMGVMGARCVFAAATLVNNSWQKVGSDYNGSILDAAHWNKGYVPTALERFYFGSLSADFQVDFPGGTYTNPANFRLMGQDGYAVTVDGANTKWVMPGSADGTELSDSDPWRIYATSSYSLFNLSISGAALYSHAISELENFKFTLNGSESNPKLVFDGGTYNFRDPAGSAWETTTKPLLLFGQGHATASSGIVFKNGASLRAWDIGVQACAPVNTVLFDGGTHYIEKFQFPDGSIDYNNLLATRSDTVLTNGATLSAASVNFGHRANKDVRLWLFGQGTELISRGQFQACSGNGTSYLTVMDGATVRLQGKTTIVSGGGGTNYTTLVGGQLVFEGSESSLRR
ncbi:MAG: hypothetical protein PHV28_05265 [Kiritimatiellae bacterium]|nr:hypothetical protein [Kiritimatiellia bacterium]